LMYKRIDRSSNTPKLLGWKTGPKSR